MSKTCKCTHDVSRHNVQDPGECYDCACKGFEVVGPLPLTLDNLQNFLASAVQSVQETNDGPAISFFPHQLLVKAIFDGLTAHNANDRWGKKNLHVSDLRITLEDPTEASCHLSLWKRLRGAKEKDATLGEMLRWDHGNRIHERIVQILRKGLEPMGWRLQAVEDKVMLPFGITGTLDLELYGPHGEFFIVDFKTVSKAAFRYLKGPKSGDVLQVQSYVFARNATGGVLLYLDREGDNGAIGFPVPRNDEKVREASRKAREMASQKEEPRRLLPVLNRSVNKGPDSLSLDLPWQCAWCPLYEISCEGALPRAWSMYGIVAYDDKKGKLTLKDTVERKNADGEKEVVQVPQEVKDWVTDLWEREQDEKRVD